MKRSVWENKSNKQLCVTIPKNSGIRKGDVVSIEKKKIERLVFSSVTADLFHYGHLQILEKTNQLGDFHVCGVLTDNAIKTYKEPPVAGFRERLAIVSGLRCVDMVVEQKSLDPTEILQRLQKEFSPEKIIIIYGSNWKEVPGHEYIKEINGEVVQPDFYEKLSTEKIVKKILQVRR